MVSTVKEMILVEKFVGLNSLWRTIFTYIISIFVLTLIKWSIMKKLYQSHIKGKSIVNIFLTNIKRRINMVDFRTVKQRYLEKGVLEVWLKDKAEVSLPVPYKNENGEIEEAFFIIKPNEWEPYAWFRIESEYGKIRVYADRRDIDFHDGFVDDKKDCVTYNKDHRTRLIELYKSIREFAFKRPLTKEERNKVIEYRRLLKTGVPQGLRRFYFSLGKDFFNWCNKQCEQI